jgi:hypothetical protein
MQWLNMLNMLNVQEVFLEDAGDINLECHQNQRSFLISIIAFFWEFF